MRGQGGRDNSSDQLAARLIGAGLQLPVFLVLRESDDGTAKWCDPDYVEVAKHWELASCGRVLGPEVVDFVSAVAGAMAQVLKTNPDPQADQLYSAGQRRRAAWERQRKTIVEWLAEVGPDALTTATRIWLRRIAKPQQLDGDDCEKCAWALVQTTPDLAGLWSLFTRNVAGPVDVGGDATPGMCGLRRPLASESIG